MTELYSCGPVRIARVTYFDVGVTGWSSLITELYSCGSIRIAPVTYFDVSVTAWSSLIDHRAV